LTQCNIDAETIDQRGKFAASSNSSNSKASDKAILLRDFPCKIDESNLRFSLDELKSVGKYTLSLVNSERAFFSDESGQSSDLVWSEALWKISLCHAKDMCEREFFDHKNPDGDSPFDRVDNATGDIYAAYGENIATSYQSNFEYKDASVRNKAALSRHLSYMNECVCGDDCASRDEGGHRKIILESDYTHVGIGAWFCASKEKWYEAQNFWRLDESISKENKYCDGKTVSDPPSPFSKHEPDSL